MEAERASQLYAVVEAGEDALARLQAALDAAPIASVLIRPAAGASLEAGSAKPLIELAQKANAAALLAGDAQLARTLRADGVHLDAGKDLSAPTSRRAASSATAASSASMSASPATTP